MLVWETSLRYSRAVFAAFDCEIRDTIDKSIKLQRRHGFVTVDGTAMGVGNRPVHHPQRPQYMSQPLVSVAVIYGTSLKPGEAGHSTSPAWRGLVAPARLLDRCRRRSVRTPSFRTVPVLSRWLLYA